MSDMAEIAARVAQIQAELAYGYTKRAPHSPLPDLEWLLDQYRADHAALAAAEHLSMFNDVLAKTLVAQLATAEARVAELEKALSLAIQFNDGAMHPTEQYADTRPMLLSTLAPGTPAEGGE